MSITFLINGPTDSTVWLKSLENFVLSPHVTVDIVGMVF
jgi:hypothetical protein